MDAGIHTALTSDTSAYVDKKAPILEGTAAQKDMSHHRRRERLQTDKETVSSSPLCPKHLRDGGPL